MADHSLRLALAATMLTVAACRSDQAESSSSASGSPPDTMTAAFEWYPSVTAPADAPMKVIQGAFVLPDGQEIGLPVQSVIHQGWGSPGNVELREPRRKGAPARLDVRWFSYTENAFFRAALPLDAPKIAALLATPFPVPTPAGTARYDGLVVGLAPEGIVTVWVTGRSQHRRVAQSVGALDTSADWKTLHPNMTISREEHVANTIRRRLGADVLEALAMRAPSGAFWRDAAIDQPLQPVVTGAATVEQVTWHYADGEVEQLLGPAALTPPARERSVPIAVSLDFALAGGAWFRADIAFNAETTLAAARRLAGTASDSPLVVAVDVSGAPGRAAVSMRGRDLLVPLETIRAEIARR